MFEPEIKFEGPGSTIHLEKDVLKNDKLGPTLKEWSEQAGKQLSLFLGQDGEDNLTMFKNTWKYSLDYGSNFANTRTFLLEYLKLVAAAEVLPDCFLPN